MADFVDALRSLTVTPLIAVDGHVTKTGKRCKTRIDRRAARHAGYAVSQRLGKRIGEGFGWIKTTGGLPGLMAEAAIRCPPAAQCTLNAAASGPRSSNRSTDSPRKPTRPTKPAANGGFFSSLLTQEAVEHLAGGRHVAVAVLVVDAGAVDPDPVHPARVAH